MDINGKKDTSMSDSKNNYAKTSQNVMDDEPAKQTVRKRDGRLEEWDLNKIMERVRKVAVDVTRYHQTNCKDDIPLDLDSAVINDIVSSGVRSLEDEIPTSKLDELTAQRAGEEMDHPGAHVLGGAILISNLRKNIVSSDPIDTWPTEIRELAPLHIKRYAWRAYHFVHPLTQENYPLISESVFRFIMARGDELEEMMNRDRDYLFKYAGVSRLCGTETLAGYLIGEYISKHSRRLIETPQHMYMRIAVALWYPQMDKIKTLYDLLSLHHVSCASPTMFNAGTRNQKMSSCYLLSIEDDSIEGIFDRVKDVARISKGSGGIGIAVSCVRARGSFISGTNGISNGIVPMASVLNQTGRYVDQGGGKRKGAIAVYVEPWHPDFIELLQTRRNVGSKIEDQNYFNPNLFFGLWIPDLFMKLTREAYCNRDEKEEQEHPIMWNFYDPAVAPGLNKVWGSEFEALYYKYEAEGLVCYSRSIRSIWADLTTILAESNMPYMLFKDHCNRKSNQKNLGTIERSNLCTEIIQYSNEKEIAVCNLASICLPKFVNKPFTSEASFDYDRLGRCASFMNETLNQVIDRNEYPTESAKVSNMRHRPMGLGWQGLSNTAIRLGMEYDGLTFRVVNRNIAEQIYHSALDASCLAAERDGYYPSMKENGGAPISHGLFQFDLWYEDCGRLSDPNPELKLDWEGLRARVKQFGVRNSLLVAPMPTASTSQILGNNEGSQPIYRLVYTRRSLTGEYLEINDELIYLLKRAGLWKTEINPATNQPYNAMSTLIRKNAISIQKLVQIPVEIRKLFKTVSDISVRDYSLMARDRGIFIDQSQSHDVYFKNDADFTHKLIKYYIWAWENGLKTASYYTRLLTDETSMTKQVTKDMKEDCVACGS